MANGSLYNVVLLNANGQETEGNQLQFTDSVAQPIPNQNPVTSGALPTTTVSSGTGKQILAGQTVTLYGVWTASGTNAIATCTVALSPDNSTYSNVQVISLAAAVNNTGAIALPLVVIVPAGWYVKFTSANGSVGTLTYA